MMPEAYFSIGSDVFASWRDDVLQGTPPTLYPIGTDSLARIEVGPGLVTILGGAPGAGKSAFAMQAVIDALRLTQELKVLVCGVEMNPRALLDRQLARMSGIDLTSIRHRRLGAEHADRIALGMNTLEAILDRLVFLRPPFDLENVAHTADYFGAELILLDYLQRIAPPGNYIDNRRSVDATMDYLRQFADAGVAVIAVAAVSRTKDSKGRSSYEGDGLNLASFRNSSELEFGADDAFILTPDKDDDDLVVLRHLKSRYGAPQNLILHFDRARQRFSSVPDERTNPTGNGRLTNALSALWNHTSPAAADVEHGGEE